MLKMKFSPQFHWASLTPHLTGPKQVTEYGQTEKIINFTSNKID